MQRLLTGWVIGLVIALAHPRDVSAQDVVDATNVVIVLDASGSMDRNMPGTRQSKMQVARQALMTVTRQLPADTRVGVIAFSGRNKANDWLHPLGPLDESRLQNALNRLRPHGNTPLGAYIRTAADRLLQQRAAQGGYGSYRLIIVTDGQASDPTLVQRYTPRVLARGLTVQVIGVAMNESHMLANRVHAYRPANDAGSLEAALTASVAEIRSTGDDTATEGDFAVIAPLPDQAAGTMLVALRSSGNEPIQTASNVQVIDDTSVSSSNAAPSLPSSSSSSGGGMPFGVVVVVMFLIFIVFRVIKKAASS